jgi:hypothetical protein
MQRWLDHDLPYLACVRIPRWTGQYKKKFIVEMHGFADASNRAYAAAMHLRIIHSPFNFQDHLT